MFFKHILVLNAVLCAFIVTSRKLPSYITPCRKNEPDLNRCMLNAVEVLRPKLKHGIPEMGLPSLDPLHIPEASLSTGQSFNATFRDIKIYEAHKFLVGEFKLNLDKIQLDMKLTFPHLRITSEYEINGKLLFIEIKGKGPADGNFTNVYAEATGTGKLVQRKAKTFLNIDKFKVFGKYGKPVFLFEKLFANNPEVTVQTNKIINENIEGIITELEPIVNQVIVDVLDGIIGRVLSKFTFDELFP